MTTLRTVGITLLLNGVAWGAANTTGTTYHMILGYGQSLSIGSGGGASISTTQPYSNVMLNSGNTAFTPLVETTPIGGGYAWNSSALYYYPAVVNLLQAWQAVTTSANVMPPSAGVWASVSTQESPLSSAINNMTYLDPAHGIVGLANNYGVSGLSITNLQRGTGPYSALIAGVTAAQNIATGAGSSLVVEGVMFTEGEADCAGNSATYEGDGVKLQSNLTTDIQAITGQTTPVRFFYSQTSSVEATSCSLHTCPDGTVACVDDPTGASAPGVVMSQFKLQADHPRLFYLTGPKYQFGYGDGVQHLDRDGYNMLGAETARILESIIVEGNTSAIAGVYPSSVTRSGNVLTATFTSPGGLGLALDTSSLPPPFRNGVSDTVGMGFQFFQTGSSLTDNACGGGPCYNGGITNVACSGLTCTITLSGTPTGANQRLAYAFEGTAGANSPQQGCAPTATSCNGLATVSPSRGALHGNLRTVADYTNLNGATVYHWTPTFNVPVEAEQPPGPAIQFVGPSGGSGSSQTFTAVYSDSRAYQALTYTYLLFGYPRNPAKACYVFYDSGANMLDLVDDSGAAIAGSVTPGAATHAQNSQCILNGAGSSVVGSGDNLTVAVSLSFKSNYTGTKAIYGFAYDTAPLNSGWQLLGSWTTNGQVVGPPAILSRTPTTGSGPSGKFVVTVSDANGASSIDWVQLTFNAPASPGIACYALFNPPTNSFYLVNDDGTGASILGPVAAGSSASVRNSQCILDGASVATSAGNQLAVTYSLKFEPAYAGAKSLYAIAYDAGGLNSNWQNIGGWTATSH